MCSARKFRFWGGVLLAGMFALSLGCGPNYKARATVKGQVSFGGKNLTTGTVMFYGKNNITGSASIDKNGKYEMNDAPLGDVQITVFVPKVPPGGINMMKGGPGAKAGKDIKSVDPSGSGKSIAMMGEMPENVVPIPDKYGNVESSGLKYTVVKGEQTYDLKLTP